MKSATQSFAEFFNKQERSYSQASDKPVVHTGFTGDNGRWNCVALAGSQDEHLIFLSLLPCRAALAQRAACAELLAPINSGLTHGCFEMDFEDGEIRYRTSLPLASADVLPELVESVVFSNLCTVDRFFGPIMKVLYAEVSPRAALRSASVRKPSTSRFQLN
jgi:hypothetical protein